jgi:hypothetical protein
MPANAEHACRPRARRKCRSALRPGCRRSSFWRVVRRSIGCGRRRPQHRLQSAVLYTLQSGQAASALAPVAAPGTALRSVWITPKSHRCVVSYVRSMTRAKVTVRSFGMVIPTFILPLVLSACGSSSSTPGDSSDPSTYPTGPDYSYVSNGSGLVSFNLVNHSIGRPIAPGTPSGFRAITIAPGGRLAYVIGTGGIERLDLATGAFSRPISTMTGWQSISLDARSQTLYLAGGRLSHFSTSLTVPA